MDPTHPPKVQNPIGRPAYHPTTKPHPVYNQTSTKPPAQYNPIGTTRPPAMIATAQQQQQIVEQEQEKVEVVCVDLWQKEVVSN
jgi:hypothetical protein